MYTIKTVFFGTHEFAATILQGLLQMPFFEVIQVITQKDQPVGRKQILTPPATKMLAQKHGIEVLQPETLKGFEFSQKDFDLSIVAQYGRIIPARLLEVPKYKTLNVHTSLLPKYRGASPIQYALWNGETETGVTIMQMDAGMDTGPILLQKKLVIDPDDTYLDLDTKLATVGIEALQEAIPGVRERILTPQAQNNAEATYTKILSRDDGKINWTERAQEIYNQYRGLTPWPGIWTMWDGKRLKLLEVQQTTTHMPLSPGQVSLEHGKILMGTSDGALEILMLQLEGKPAMDAKTFANGYHNIQGVILG